MEEEHKQDVPENFNKSMLEFNNSEPHELERCRAVSKIGLKIDVKGLPEKPPLQKALSYIDFAHG